VPSYNGRVEEDAADKVNVREKLDGFREPWVADHAYTIEATDLEKI
jgi:hypothetical protein